VSRLMYVWCVCVHDVVVFLPASKTNVWERVRACEGVMRSKIYADSRPQHASVINYHKWCHE
jgi:hypothetical protein